MDEKIDRFLGETSADSKTHSQTDLSDGIKRDHDFGIKRSKRPNSGSLRKLAKRRSVLDDSLDNWTSANVDSSSEKPSLTAHEGHRTKLAGFYYRKNNTVKVQRYGCLDCPSQPRYSADPVSVRSKLFPWASRYSDEEVKRIINGWVDGRMTYRRLVRNIGLNVSLATAFRLVTAAAKNCKTPLEVSLELKPKWGFYLQVDATSIRLNGMILWLFTAIDTTSQDIIHAQILNNDSRLIEDFLSQVRDKLRYQPKLITIDDDPSLKKAAQKIFPFVPIQICAWHKYDVIDEILPERKISDNQRQLKYKIKEFLYANSLDEALQIYRYIIDNANKWPEKKSQRAIRSIRQDLKFLTTHFRVDNRLGLGKSPRTNSVIEGFFSRFKMKVKQMRGFKSADNLPAIMNLLIMHYRASRFDGADDKRSPLERAQTPVSDWIEFSQPKSTNETN